MAGANNTAQKPQIGRPFEPGNRANPAGRPKGSRNKLGEQFLADMYSDWQQNGASVIASVRAEKPEVYLKVVASILPKELNIKVSELDDLSDADLDRRIATIAKTIVEAGNGDPLGGESQEASAQPAEPVQAIH
jgi:hypothetical protein